MLTELYKAEVITLVVSFTVLLIALWAIIDIYSIVKARLARKFKDKKEEIN